MGDTSQIDGAVRLTQHVTSVSLRTRDGSPDVESLSGSGLDEQLDYRGAEGLMSDSPTKGLGDTWDWRSTIESYEMYLMFRPNTPNAIWVPLKKIEWWWSFTAEQDSLGWYLIESNGTFDAHLDGQDTTSFPEWSMTVQEAIEDPDGGEADWQ